MILIFNLKYNFNRVFGISVTQADVYAANVEKLVSSIKMANS
jgi:hypothetical protein